VLLATDGRAVRRKTLKRLTIKDIASRAGVSVSTVSRVLNNKGNVDNVLREKVMDVVKSTGFRPSNAAVSFRKGMDSIGVIANMDDEASVRVLKGVLQVFSQRGVWFRFVSCNDPGELSFDKVLITGDMPAPMQIQAQKKVYAGTWCADGVSVCPNYYRSAFMVGEHLYSKGARNFILITGEIKKYKHARFYAGFLKAMYVKKIDEYSVFHGEVSAKFGFETTKKLPLIPDAIICSDDVLALGVIKALESEGINALHKTIIAGCGNSLILSTNYSFVTVETFAENIGTKAAEILLNDLYESDSPETILMPTKVIDHLE